MELILWRHVEVEDGVPDTERKLTNKRVGQAKSMANWLKSKLPENMRVIVSPAKRTQQTAMVFGCDFETNKQGNCTRC
jgi:phosphohistidine phosphatase